MLAPSAPSWRTLDAEEGVLLGALWRRLTGTDHALLFDLESAYRGYHAEYVDELLQLVERRLRQAGEHVLWASILEEVETDLDCDWYAAIHPQPAPPLPTSAAVVEALDVAREAWKEDGDAAA